MEDLPRQRKVPRHHVAKAQFANLPHMGVVQVPPLAEGLRQVAAFALNLRQDRAYESSRFPSDMAAHVMGKERSRLRHYVVVEEEENVTMRDRCTRIPCESRSIPMMRI